MKVFAFCLMSLASLLLCVNTIAIAQTHEALKSEIYAKLKCCSCSEDFTPCTCPEAKEMKAYIDALLETGLPKEEIFYKIAKKFSLKVIIDEAIRSEVEKRLIKEVDSKRPQILLENATFDFGELSKKEGKVSRAFTISNKGNSLLIIKSIKTSCPCATSSLTIDKIKSPYFGTEGSPQDWHAEIKPGESAKLEMVIDLASTHVKPGKIIRETSILSNDPLYPEMVVRMEGIVKE